jgi:hypothetical protein
VAPDAVAAQGDARTRLDVGAVLQVLVQLVVLDEQVVEGGTGLGGTALGPEATSWLSPERWKSKMALS